MKSVTVEITIERHEESITIVQSEEIPTMYPDNERYKAAIDAVCNRAASKAKAAVSA